MSRLQSSCCSPRKAQDWKGAAFPQVPCSPFPLPDQHWSDDSPSDAETEFCRQHQEVVEAELELNISENQDERPPATLQHNKRGKSTVTREATPRIPAESHWRTSGTTRSGHEAEGAHIIPASDNGLLPLCTGPARGFTNSPFLCVIWNYERVAGTAQIFLSQTIHMTQAEVAYGTPWGSTFLFFPSLQVVNQWFNPTAELAR